MTNFCPYCCTRRIDFLKHSFEAYGLEPDFELVCGINECLHSFKCGATFSSFKTHASRNHLNWRDNVEGSTVNLESQAEVSVTLTPGPDDSPAGDDSERIDDLELNEEESFVDAALELHRTAALFLLTFQEQYRLPQVAIYYAVKSIHEIVAQVSDGIRESVQILLGESACPIHISSAFKCREHTFTSLETKFN